MPIIINNTREVPCVVVEGKRYCEREDVTPKEFGLLLLILGGLVLYLVIIYWISDFFDREWLFLAGILIPIFLGGLYLFFE